MRPVVNVKKIKASQAKKKGIQKKYKIMSEDAKLSQLNPIVRVKKVNKKQPSTSLFRPYPKLKQPKVNLEKIDKTLLKPVSINLKKLDARKNKPYVAAKDKKEIIKDDSKNKFRKNAR